MRITTGMLQRSSFLNSNLLNSVRKTRSAKTDTSNDYYSQLRNKVIQNSGGYAQRAGDADSTERSSINSSINSYDQYGALGQSGYNRDFLSTLLSSRYNFWG